MEKSDLPVEFLNNMKEILKDDFQDFLMCFENKNYRKSITLNCKVNNDLKNKFMSEFEKIDLTEFGYFIPIDYKIGSSILNHAGIIYSQDSSAMIPVELLGVEKGDFVLDLCSAPGGKSIQILNKLNDSGLLISNEVIKSRASVLYENLTKMGFKNFILSNSFVTDFEKSGLIFDKILVDAPCSGEGLFVKSKDKIDWKESYIKSNAERQLDLLNSIKGNLKRGGVLVYSTCTFNLEENEKVVENFLNKNNNFKILKPKDFYFNKLDHGFKIGSVETQNTVRCYPHKNNGAGQFVAVMQKIDGEDKNNKEVFYKLNLGSKEKNILEKFLVDFLTIDKKIVNNCYKNNNNIILRIKNLKGFEKLNILCDGIIIGELKKNIIKPNHSLFKRFAEYFKNRVELSFEDALKYIKGEQIVLLNSITGYGVFTYGGFALGGFKASGNIANNLYPKNLRLN